MKTQWLLILISLMKLINCQIEPYIVGGGFASIKRYPHSAFLSISCGKNSGPHANWICGASVVNQRLLLTAAHCLATCGEDSGIVATVGSENRMQGINVTAHSFVVHDSYNPLTSAADIGLVRLYLKLQFNTLIRRVALMSQPPYHEQAYVAGWGLIDENEHQLSPFLKHIDQKVWSNRICLKVLNAMPVGCICASARNISDYASSGDSGSALIVRGYIQIGLVSHKIPTRATHIIVYTDVGHYYEWIKVNAQRLYCV